MANNKKDNKEALKKTLEPEPIKPEDTKMEDDDSDMPAPQTKVYKQLLKVTPLFMQRFHQCVDSLPYRTVLSNNSGQQQRLVEVVKFVEANNQKMEVGDMNIIISYIENLDFAHARPLMEIIDVKENQAKLWTIFEA